MSFDNTEVQVAVLAIATIIGIMVAVHIARRLRRLLNFRTLLLFNYVLVTSVSGMAHLTNNAASRVGYFDVRSAASSESATISTCVGLISLCVALLHKLPRAQKGVDGSLASKSPTIAERRFLLYLSLLLLPLTIWATFIIQDYTAQLDSERIVAIDGGMARYSYAAKWFAWAASFAAIWILSTKLGKNRLFASMTVAVCVLSIVGSMAWSGGRSIVLVMVFPIVLVLLPKLRGMTWILWPIGVASFANYIINVSLLRGGSADTHTFRSWLDWQWGRFSMMGWADEQVTDGGLRLGETFASVAVSLIGGILRLAGFQLDKFGWVSSTQLAGNSLRGDNTTWIVPGLNAELYLNFGLIGVAVGLYALGRVVNWMDSKYAHAPTITLRLTYAYIGTVLVLRSIPSDSGSIPAYLLYIGAPLLLAGLYSYLTLGKTRQQTLKGSGYEKDWPSFRSSGGSRFAD
jgi:hypothetical protein